MNTLQQLVAVAGQQTVEQYYGATILFGGKIWIPCAATKVEKDFELEPGGRSPKSFVDTCTFLKTNIGQVVPAKGILCQLKQTPDSAAVALQFWNGGLLQDGITFQFMLVDANYKA
jgi:hypothetical protein